MTSIARPVVSQSPKVATNQRINDAKATVTTGFAPKSSKRAQELEDVSDVSDNEEQQEEEVDSEDEKTQKTPKSSKKAARAASKQIADVDTEMTSPEDAQEAGDASDDEAISAPTFGDLVRNHTTVDVTSALAAQASTAAARTSTQSRSLAPPTSTSLGTVLNQALKTDDRDLLESCLQVNDAQIIQNTINRMDSTLAGVLLSKLADRLHRRPGRTLGLMRWVQWTLIAHGGALVAQPGARSKLDKLSAVLQERAKGLGPLLALKGKLDMLEAQMQMRKVMEGSGDDDDEPGYVYVEGQEDQPKARTNGVSAAKSKTEDDEDDIDEGNDFGDDSEEESDEEDEEDLAEEDLSEMESMDEDDQDLEDIEDESGEEDEEDDDDEVAPPPAKVQKTSKSGKRK